jgi:hypothetical protein
MPTQTQILRQLTRDLHGKLLGSDAEGEGAIDPAGREDFLHILQQAVRRAQEEIALRLRFRHLDPASANFLAVLGKKNGFKASISKACQHSLSGKLCRVVGPLGDTPMTGMFSAGVNPREQG